MNLVPVMLDYLPLAALVGALGLAGALCELRHRRALRGLSMTVTLQAERIVALERNLSALLTCSRGVAERLGTTEKQQRSLQTQVAKLSNADDNQVAVQHAMKLLNSGLDLKNVTTLCELSEGEVEILQALARHQRAA